MTIAGRALLPVFFLPLFLHGQDIIEHSLATAQAGAAAAGMQGVSQSIGGVFGSLGRVLGASGKSQSEETAGVAARRGRVTSTPAPATEAFRTEPVHPHWVHVGMERSALVTRFGKPFVKTSRVEGPQLVETYYYPSPDGDMIVITVREGKVTAISPPPGTEEPKSTGGR